MTDDELKPADAPLTSAEASSWSDEYTAFEKWEYDKVFQTSAHEKPWIDISDSFYNASKAIVESVVSRKLYDEIEGIAAVFLFRHYLELALKRIVFNGRWLKNKAQNARPEEVAELNRTHRLKQLWDLVLADARPKIAESDWDNYDVDFVEQCILEFDFIDPKSEAFRYQRQGTERLNVNFAGLLNNMEHVHQVLEGINTYLIETYGQNQEWEDFLRSEYLSSI